MTTSADNGVMALLDMLEVPRHGVLYVQASADWMQRAGFGIAETLTALVEWTGERGTLAMPSYPFQTPHREYLESGPTYDVRRSAAAIGLLPEMFRRTAGARRSLDPDFCVTARGADADAIVGSEPADRDPFGAGSSYQRMLDRGATLLGLGVSLNTNSFIHVIDSRAESGYPSPVYDDHLFSTTVVDAAGETRVVMRKALRPEFQQLTAPSTIQAAMQPPPEVFATVEINGARFFRWDLAAWAAWCLDHAAARSREGRWPVWLDRLG